MQLELIEIPRVRRMDPQTLQKLTEPTVAHYNSLNGETAAALDNFVPAYTSFLISGGSKVHFQFRLNITFHFCTDQHVHSVVPHIVSSRKYLANFIM